MGESAIRSLIIMKIKIWTFSEDTDANGTTSHIFKSETELRKHLKSIIIDRYGDDVKAVDGKWVGKDLDDANQRVLELLNDLEIEEAFHEWMDSSGWRNDLDTYNWDAEEIDVSEQIASYSENLAAICELWYGSAELASAFYDREAQFVGGFPGINKFLIDAADAFTEAEPDDWTEANWPEIVEKYVCELFKHDKILDWRSLHELALTVIPVKD